MLGLARRRRNPHRVLLEIRDCEYAVVYIKHLKECTDKKGDNPCDNLLRDAIQLYSEELRWRGEEQINFFKEKSERPDDNKDDNDDHAQQPYVIEQ